MSKQGMEALSYKEIIEQREKGNAYFKNVCPRCGNFKMGIIRKSSSADVLICEECSRDEDLRKFYHCELDIRKWYIISERKY